MSNLFARFVKDESGATAIEYGLIAGLMAVAVIAAVTALKDPLEKSFKNVGDSLTKTTGTAKTNAGTYQ